MARKARDDHRDSPIAAHIRRREADREADQESIERLARLQRAADRAGPSPIPSGLAAAVQAVHDSFADALFDAPAVDMRLSIEHYVQARARQSGGGDPPAPAGPESVLPPLHPSASRAEVDDALAGLLEALVDCLNTCAGRRMGPSCRLIWSANEVSIEARHWGLFADALVGRWLAASRDVDLEAPDSWEALDEADGIGAGWAHVPAPFHQAILIACGIPFATQRAQSADSVEGFGQYRLLFAPAEVIGDLIRGRVAPLRSRFGGGEWQGIRYHGGERPIPWDCVLMAAYALALRIGRSLLGPLDSEGRAELARMAWTAANEASPVIEDAELCGYAHPRAETGYSAALILADRVEERMNARLGAGLRRIVDGFREVADEQASRERRES